MICSSPMPITTIFSRIITAAADSMGTQMSGVMVQPMASSIGNPAMTKMPVPIGPFWISTVPSPATTWRR